MVVTLRQVTLESSISSIRLFLHKVHQGFQAFDDLGDQALAVRQR